MDHMCVVCSVLKPPLISLSPGHRMILELVVSSAIDMTPLKSRRLLICLECKELIETVEEFRTVALTGIQRLINLIKKNNLVNVDENIILPMKEELLLKTEVDTELKLENLATSVINETIMATYKHRPTNVLLNGNTASQNAVATLKRELANVYTSGADTEVATHAQDGAKPFETDTPEHTSINFGMVEALDTPPHAKRPKTHVYDNYVYGFDECVSDVMTQPHQSSLRDTEMDDIINYGTEEDEENNDEIGVQPLVPRSLRIFLEADEETPDRVTSEVQNSTVEDGGEMPKTIHDFQWKAFPSPPTYPPLRREPFVGSCGPIIDPTGPYDIFVNIWDRSIMQHIAHQTNIYAQEYANRLFRRGEIGPSSRITQWKDTDIDELYVYFALVTAMGVVVKSKLKEYWTNDRTIFSTPGFSASMSLRRFQLLTRCLHFNVNASSPNSVIQAEIFKVQPIVQHLNLKFSTLYGLGQNIAIDESLSQWKSWNFEPFLPNEISTGGIKSYEVCDCRTGYLWRFEVHAKDELEESMAIPNLVLRLLQGLEHRGHTVWMDSHYNSSSLARILKSLGYDCAGPIRTDRLYVPDQIRNLKKSEMPMGQSGCTSGDVDLIVWHKNRVAMISTYHGIAMSDKPIIIEDYINCMGGLDRKDRMLITYPMERNRTQEWYKKFFRRLLNVSILNAFILHRHKSNLQHRDFRMSLVTELLQRHQQRAETSLVSVRGNQKFTAEVVSHFPAVLPTLPGGEKVGKQRRQCVVCKTKRTHCVQCVQRGFVFQFEIVLLHKISHVNLFNFAFALL